MSDSPILAGLNEAQRRAVTAGEGPHLVLAGPGSGKTRVLTHRIAYLIQEMGVHPYRIMAVTFTNKAAREMKARAERLLAEQEAATSGLTIGTFHATCARILRIEADHLRHYTRDYAIFDTRDQLAAVKQAALDLNVDIKRFNPRSLLNAISAAKNDLLGPERYADRASTYFGEVAGRVYFGYRDILRRSNALDFDDLLMQTVLLFAEQPDIAAKYQERLLHLLVDEFQDTNFAQYKLVQAIAAPQENLFAVGDPDQSIYAFRGADYRNVMRFEADYPNATTILLEQNYRSTQHILDAAMAVIDRNPQRTPKRLFTDRGMGEQLRLYEAYDQDDEGRFIVETLVTLHEGAAYNLNECAVMYRTNAQSRALEEAFRRAGVPYRIIAGTRFYDRREVRDLIAYLRVIHNPNDTVSLDRVLNTPPRGIGAKTQEQLTAWAAEQGVTPGVALLSLHAGAEGPFNSRARRALDGFAALLAGWSALVEEGHRPLDILDAVLVDAEYEGYLRNGSPEGEDRWENVMELRAEAAEHATLTDMLTNVALVADVDALGGEQDEGPALMTLHSAKGLEFPVVCITGLEEGILPHARSVEDDQNGDPNALPEERRLLYVGLTRAQDRLYLSYAFRRARYGDYEPSLPSRFLHDLPPDALADSPLHTSSRRAQSAYQRMTSWAQDVPGQSRGRDRTTPHPDSPTPSTRYGPGMRVMHPVFGEGTVIAARTYRDTEEVEVQFETSGRKRIDGGFLTPLYE